MTSYPLASTTWDEAETDAINRVVSSGKLSMGECVAEFEDAFARHVGADYCVMVNSGSSANLLMIAALFCRERDRLSDGDEVIVPAVSWSTTYYPLHQYGLRIKFVDIDQNTLNYDLSALAEAISDRTRLLVAVNLLGNPNDFDAINRLIAGRSITVIEDNCESMGALYKGKQTGTFGLMGSFSTYFSHHISTMEGGIIVTDDEELWQILLSLRSHGWTRGLPSINRIDKEPTGDPFLESFRFILPGYNVRPLELTGAIGLAQLHKLPDLVNVRRDNAELFRKLFGSHPYISIQQETGESSWFGFAMTLRKAAPFTRTELVRSLERHGIESRPIVAGNFTRNPVIKWFQYDIHGELANADRVHDRGLFVGNHHYSIDRELHYLEQVINSTG